MILREKTVLMDNDAVKRAIYRMACEIMDKNYGPSDMAFIGIQKKGVFLAKEIINKIEELEGVRLPLGTLDITFYRDDLTRLTAHPVVMGNNIPFTVEDKKIILVDDVLYSGRTVRAAIEELFDMGRPAKIDLAVLVDRGHHELPLRGDYVGRDIPTGHSEYIDVKINDDDTIASVSLCSKEEQ